MRARHLVLAVPVILALSVPARAAGRPAYFLAPSPTEKLQAGYREFDYDKDYVRVLIRSIRVGELRGPRSNFWTRFVKSDKRSYTVSVVATAQCIGLVNADAPGGSAIPGTVSRLTVVETVPTPTGAVETVFPVEKGTACPLLPALVDPLDLSVQVVVTQKNTPQDKLLATLAKLPGLKDLCPPTRVFAEVTSHWFSVVDTLVESLDSSRADEDAVGIFGIKQSFAPGTGKYLYRRGYYFAVWPSDMGKLREQGISDEQGLYAAIEMTPEGVPMLKGKSLALLDPGVTWIILEVLPQEQRWPWNPSMVDGLGRLCADLGAKIPSCKADTSEETKQRLNRNIDAGVAAFMNSLLERRLYSNQDYLRVLDEIGFQLRSYGYPKEQWSGADGSRADLVRRLCLKDQEVRQAKQASAFLTAMAGDPAKLDRLMWTCSLADSFLAMQPGDASRYDVNLWADAALEEHLPDFPVF